MIGSEVSADKEKIVLNELTHPQKRIWYIEKIYPNTSLYNIGGTARIKGHVDFSLLEESIRILIKTNDGIRLHFIEKNGTAYQYVKPYDKIDVDFMDFSQCKDPETEFKNWVSHISSEPFKLDDKPLFYFAMFKLSENDNGYLIKFHHLISDGWSVNVMNRQVCDNYMQLLKYKAVKHTEEYSYLEYIGQEHKYLNSERFIKDKQYWYEKFKVLPEKFLDKSTDSIKGMRSSFALDEDTTSTVKDFITANKYSVNTFFVALILLYIRLSTRQEDIIIGTPVMNRSGKREKNMFGMFTSTMPFRIALDDRWTFFELMDHVNGKLKNCYFHQRYPYDLLISDLELKKRGYDDLFQICVNYYNTKMITELDGIAVENEEFYNGNQLYSLQIVVREWSDSGRLQMDFDYKTDDYSTEQIDCMANHLKILAKEILAAPGEILGNVTCLSEEEKHEMLYTFNASKSEYPADKTICELIEEQVERTPDCIAASFKEISLTYRELNERANRLAGFLKEKGVVRETIVGLMVSHSLEMLIGILGILKSGGAYLPIDPDYPAERIEYLLEDSGLGILLTNIPSDKNLQFKGSIFRLDDKSIFTGDAQNPGRQSGPNDLVYIIYTSGSTGKPKGVMIENRGLVNYIWWAKKVYVKSDDDAFALYSSLSFDLTVTSIFTPLIAGNKIVIYRDDEDEYVLYKIMKENKVSIVKLTPSHLSLLKDMDNESSSVKRFIVGGEDLKTHLAAAIHESFHGKIEIYNEYGPTETVVGCMIYKYDYVNDQRTSVPIGIPADNVQIYILNDQLKLLPKGSCGEMYISGDGVARGYLKKPDLTNEKFLDNPYIKGSKLYKTGDYARYLDNGIIEYSGRMDHQVKIRGYRIELGEIEKHLLNLTYIKDSVVIDREDTQGHKYLCAYVTATKEISETEIRRYLSKLLPEYMLPARTVCMESLPLTPNGKINRSLLPEPGQMEDDTVEVVAPGNIREEKLIGVMKQVLGVDRIGMKDNFFTLGGDSIKAIQAASKLNQMGLKIKVKDILSNTVFEEMVMHLENSLPEEALEQEPCEGYVINTPIVSWFFSQHFEDINYYHQSVLLALKPHIDIQTVQWALNELIRHHDALRLNYDQQAGGLFFNPEYLSGIQAIQEFNLSGITAQEQDASMVQIGEELKSGFSIQNGSLLKACIFDLGQRGNRLLLTAHHLVVDGVSWRILLDDLAVLLQQKMDGKQAQLPLKTLSIQKWALALEEYAKGLVLEESGCEKPVTGLPGTLDTDFDRGKDTLENCRLISWQLDSVDTERLINHANSVYDTRSGELLLISLLLATKDFCGRNSIVLELEEHGRKEIFENVDISRTVGWFTCMYPAVFTIEEGDLSSKIKSLKEQIRKISAQGFEHGLRDYLSCSSKHTRIKHIRYNYLGEFDNVQGNGLFTIASESTGPDCSKRNEMTCLLEINAMIINGKLDVNLTYSTNRFKHETIARLMDGYRTQLGVVLEHCCSKTSRQFTPSDFETVDLLQEELDGLFG